MLVTLYDQSIPHCMEGFIENFNKRNCVHYASAIFEDEDYSEEISINLAVQRAQSICRTLNIPIAENFSSVFRAIDNEVYVDWKLSKFAVFLTLMNGNPSSPRVANFQLACYKK